MKTYRIVLILYCLTALWGCTTTDGGGEISEQGLTRIDEPQAMYRTLPPVPSGVTPVSVDSKKGKLNAVIYMAEYITTGESVKIGRTVFFSDRGNKQLDGDFVPALSALTDGTTNITYYVDNKRPSGDLPATVTEAAIDRAMNTWDNIGCSELGMTKIPYDRRKTGFVSLVFGFGGSQNYTADVTHSGWLPGEFFDLIDDDGGDYILGVTFTIVFTDDAGNLVDTDNNGKYDIAWREIYYNDEFDWNDGSTYDVETIALHEAGHGLSQAHFGAAFLTANGKLHFSPRAVMNAAYSGVQTKIESSDLAGHCSNWSSWPLE